MVAKIRGTLRQAEREKLKAKSQNSIELSTLSFQPSAPSPKVKVGHTGTLDPLATGLMVVVIGTYCKRASEFSGLDKAYDVIMKLGQTSSTGDKEGEITTVSSVQPSEEAILAALEQSTGEIMQTPPAYSAIKINGQRAYKLARAGKEVTIEPRKVMIHSIRLTDYIYPEVTFTARIGSGTYIRSLAEAIGKILGTGAYVSVLRRTHVGTFDLKDAMLTGDLTGEIIANNLIQLTETMI